MTPEEIAADRDSLIAQLATVTAERDVAREMIETKSAFASGLESQLSAAFTERDASTAQVGTLAGQVATLMAEVESLRPPAGAVVPRDTFLESLGPAFLRLRALDQGARDGWLALIRNMLPESKPTVNKSSLTVQRLVAGAAVADGLLTQEEAAAVLEYEESP